MEIIYTIFGAFLISFASIFIGKKFGEYKDGAGEIIFTVVVIVIGSLLIVCGINLSYKQGQIDYMNGKIKYEKVVQTEEVCKIKEK